MKRKIKTEKTQGKSSINNLFLLLPFIKKYKNKVILVIAALIATSSMVLFIGKIIKHLIDFGFTTQNYENLNTTLIGFILSTIILAVAGYFRSSLINEVGERVVNDLRQKIYQHIIFTSADFFEKNKIGDIISRLTVDTTLLYNIISNSISFFLRNLVLLFGSLIFLLLTSAKLTLIAIFLIPIAIFPIIKLGKKVKKLSLKTQERVSELGSHIEESINGIKTIQSYQKESYESNIFNNLSNITLKVSVQKIKVRSLLISLVIFISFSFVGLILWLGSVEVINGKMSAGTLSSFIFYSIILATSLASISQTITQLQTASGAAQRLFDILKIQPSVKEIKNPVKLPKNIQDGKNISIQLEDVEFSYKGRKNHKTLNKFNLYIRNDEKVAIVGPSGGGKTTIFQLLMRFYDIDKGRILINKKYDLQKISLKDLRSLFSYISQDSFIFSGTILENITYANNEVKVEEIKALINSNKAFDFINKLPNNLDCHIGQKGIKLSGGERQRIAILRAIIKDSPILLLDEATSSVDNKNEQYITELINKFAKNKIVITIAHRLSTIQDYDRIIFMQDGRIVESGKHKDLIAKNGLYKSLSSFAG